MINTLRHNYPLNQISLIFRYICKLYLPLLTLVSLLLLQSLTYGSEIKEEKRLLILFTNRSDLPAYSVVEKGIKSSLKAGTEFSIEYFIEFMDFYRDPDPTYSQFLLEAYNHKFSKHKIDLVIPYSASALSLVIAHANDLFSKTPVVFSGVLREQLKGLNLGPMVTGVLADIDYAGLLESALKIHPRTRHVAIVNGTSVVGKLYEKEFRKALEPYARRLDLIYLTGIPMDDILEKVQNLPEHSVVLYYILIRDGEGKNFIPREVASRLSKVANAPVYGCLDTYLGYGVVGGRMASMEMTGVEAGEMALRILRGEKPSNIPITSEGTNIDLFDWRQFKRFKIQEDRLPPDSIVRYKTYSFWELYRTYIVGTVFLILVQSGLISFLLWQRAQRRRVEARYRTVADFTYAWEYWANLDDSLEYVSPSCERISDYQTRDFFDNPTLLKEIILPEDRELWNRHYHDSRQELKPCEIQFRIQRRDGQIRWIEHNCQPVIDAQGHLQGFRASNRDITTRKQGEELLKQNQQDLSRLAGRIISTQEEELQRLSREIHDDLTQRLASLALDAALIEKQINPTQQSRTVGDLKGLRNNLSEVADQVHDLSRRLHPSVLDDLGLEQAVQAESAAFKSKTEIELSITIGGLPESVPPKAALCVYRVIQEGLQNIAKHSGAKLASITLQGRSNGIRLLIEDKGGGFDPQEVRKKAGIGLSSMRERVRLLNGTISFASKQGQGTKIEVFIPTKEAP